MLSSSTPAPFLHRFSDSLFRKDALFASSKLECPSFRKITRGSISNSQVRSYRRGLGIRLLRSESHALHGLRGRWLSAHRRSARRRICMARRYTCHEFRASSSRYVACEKLHLPWPVLIISHSPPVSPSLHLYPSPSSSLILPSHPRVLSPPHLLLQYHLIPTQRTTGRSASRAASQRGTPAAKS